MRLRELELAAALDKMVRAVREVRANGLTTDSAQQVDDALTMADKVLTTAPKVGPAK